MRDAWAGEALPDLIRMANTNKGDSFTKLWYANAIWELAGGPNVSTIIKEQAQKTAVGLWQSLNQEPIEISENSIAKISPHMKALRASTPQEYVLHYAKRKLTEAKAKGYTD